MKTIKLYGHLGKMFGKKHVLNVTDSYDAIRALCANFPNFKHELAKHQRKYKVAVNNRLVESSDELLLPAHEIKFIPVIGGAGNGVGQIIIGAALVVASFFMPYASGFFFAVGASLMISGVTQMLSKTPQGQQQQQQQNDLRNYNLSGSQNNTGQGNPVPILYGRMIVGSQVISASIQSADISFTSSSTQYSNTVNYKGQY